MDTPTEPVAEPPATASRAEPRERAHAPRSDRNDAAGSEDSGRIAEWIRATETATRRYTRLLGCPEHLAEDLIQEAYLAALQKAAHQLPFRASTAWLRTAVRNLWQYHHRSNGRRPSSISLHEVDEIWARHERGGGGDSYADALRQCLSTLGSKERQAIDLRYGQDLDPLTVGQRLGLQPEGSKSLLRRARARLRACINRRSAEHPSA
ncbi:MAG: RNA polymerase sigma factor [Planctomycetota bacterium]